MSCVLQRENGKTLESDFARLSCCCLLSWVMPQAHLENPVIFCVCSFRAFSLCLFPVLCSIMKVFRKNFIIIWLGKMEGFVWVFFFLCLRQLFQAYFCPCGRIPTGLCPRGRGSITEIKFNECPFDSPSFISNILLTGQGQGFVVMALMQTPKQPKSKQWTSCNRVIQDIHSVDLIALKSSPSDRTAQS